MQVLRFADAAAYHILWADTVVVELPALEAAGAGAAAAGATEEGHG